MVEFAGAFARPLSTVRLLVAIAWTVTVLVMLWSPPPPPPDFVIPHFDKYVHFTLFFGIGVVWRFAAMRVGWVLVAGVVLGAVTEVVQASLPWPRSADALDVLADAVGLVLAVGVAAVVGRLAQRRGERPPAH